MKVVMFEVLFVAHALGFLGRCVSRLCWKGVGPIFGVDHCAQHLSCRSLGPKPRGFLGQEHGCFHRRRQEDWALSTWPGPLQVRSGGQWRCLFLAEIRNLVLLACPVFRPRRATV